MNRETFQNSFAFKQAEAEYEQASFKERSASLLSLLLQYLQQIGEKPAPFTENSHKALLELEMTEEDILKLKEEIEKRQ